MSQTISHYRLLKKLGAGGMGEVYLAEDTQLGRKVALKLLRAEFTQNQDLLRRFEQEARAASALNHPNILTIYEIGRADAGHFIATEFVEGETLRQQLMNGPMKLGDALDIAVQVAGALAAAHEAGIVHRDIKPENIMVRPDGYVKILDFGLAKLIEKPASTFDTEAATLVDAQTTPGTIMGTIPYMSPEQVRGRAVDLRTDIFSLGDVIYEMVAGRPPFEGETTSDLIAAILTKNPPPLAQLSEEVPEALDGIVTKALSKDRDERYQTVKELLADLKTLKRRLEFESEREHSLRPGLPSGATTAATAEQTATATGQVPAARTTSSLQYLISEVTRHKRATVLALTTLVIVAAAITLLWSKLTGTSFQIPFEQFTLKNGLRVILSEDHSAPTYSISVTYNVGSRDERPGKAGLAHLVEHIMFQGSANVGKGEHFLLISNNGGSMNGTTSWDHTRYFQTLPANQLDLGLFLEADRMKSLVINQANLDNSRQVVKEERRLSIDNQPYGKTNEVLFDTAYDNFAYKHPVIGSMEDLNAASVQDISEFFKTYYAPNNAVLALVGDFKTKEALAKIEKYFEGIPSQPPPPRPDLTEPPQQGERRKTIEDAFAQSPALVITYKSPPGNTAEWYAVKFLSLVLTGGHSSRLNQKLVKEKEVAASVSGNTLDLRGPSLTVLNVVPRSGKDLAEIEKLVYEEIERLKNEPVSDWEVQKGLMQLRRDRAQQLQTTLARSIVLGQYAATYNEPALINTLEEKFRRLSKEDFQRAAQMYLTEANRTVITIMPKTGAARSAQPQPGPPSQVIGQATGQDSKAIPVSKTERKNRAPVSREILQVKFPRAVETTLENGLTVLILEDHRFPTVSVELNISGAGPLHEPADLPGLAYVTTQMLNEGTTAHTSKEIAEELEKRGVAYNAFSPFGSDAAVIRASGLSDNLDEWFALISEVALTPTFPVDELNSLKQRMKVQWQIQRSSPTFLANERLNRAVFGQHPAAVMIYTPESLGAFTPELLTKWHRERYVPQNAILGIVGDVRADELVPKLRKWLAGWQRTDLKPMLPPNPTPAAVRKVHVVDRPGSAQTTIAMGNLTIDRRDPDYLPMIVLNRVLGEGPAARLFIKLREEKGYTYNISSSFTAPKHPGGWRVIGDTRPEVTEAMLAEFFNEVRRLSDERVPQAELEDAERAVAARFALSLEQPTQLLSYAITRKVYGFSADYWDSYPAKIMGVSADDIQRLARRYFNPDALQVVAVGDGRGIQRVLEKYGPVEVYDTEGRPITAKTAASASRAR